MKLKNVLVNEMPLAIKVNGIQFILWTDYRVWIEAGELIQKIGKLSSVIIDLSKNKADESKITAKIEERFELFSNLCNLVIQEYPKDKDYPEDEYPAGAIVSDDDLLYGLIDFYKGFPKAENEETEKKKNNSKDKAPSFDFEYDAGFIYCSFASFYNIRLQTLDYMHWWEFLELFNGLMMSDQTSVNFVVGARQQPIKSDLPKPEKTRLQKLKKQFALPMAEEDKKVKDNALDFLKKGGKNNGTRTENQN